MDRNLEQGAATGEASKTSDQMAHTERVQGGESEERTPSVSADLGGRDLDWETESGPLPGLELGV